MPKKREQPDTHQSLEKAKKLLSDTFNKLNSVDFCKTKFKIDEFVSEIIKKQLEHLNELTIQELNDLSCEKLGILSQTHAEYMDKIERITIAGVPKIDVKDGKASAYTQTINYPNEFMQEYTNMLGHYFPNLKEVLFNK
jgi:hypothetical protein